MAALLRLYLFFECVFDCAGGQTMRSDASERTGLDYFDRQWLMLLVQLSYGVALMLLCIHTIQMLKVSEDMWARPLVTTRHHACIHAHMHTRIRAYVHMHAHMHMRACMHACVRR